MYLIEICNSNNSLIQIISLQVSQSYNILLVIVQSLNQHLNVFLTHFYNWVNSDFPEWHQISSERFKFVLKFCSHKEESFFTFSTVYIRYNGLVILL